MIDFVVEGTPKSQQAENPGKQQWKQEVWDAAPKLPKLLTDPLRLRIYFFVAGAYEGDTDNLIKPIQDALEGAIYENDRIVIDVCAHQINQQHLPSIGAVPAVLLRALAQQSGDFVFIQIALAQGAVAFL